MAATNTPTTPTKYSHPQGSPILFETAWEVCNQVGGIYTVIKTKATAMLDQWGQDYFLIGPYHHDAAAVEFEPAPVDGSLSAVFQELEEGGLRCHFGRWLITGKPYVILIEYQARLTSLDRDKYFLWKDHGIGTPEGDAEVNNTIAFGFAVTEFFKVLVKHFVQRPIIAHFHEWLAGVPILRIAHLHLPVATVFTTHATLLGRYMASDNPRFYEELNSIDPDGAAHRYNIYARYSLEKGAAKAATIFTTISEVTAREAERFLDRKADFILPNGLNVQRFTALHEFQNLHLTYKDRIHEFIMGHFFPSYTFDLDRTLYIVTSGRYEYRNKGMDLFIEALYRLNLRLKEYANPPTIVAFIVTRTASRNINVNALHHHLMFDDLKRACADLEAGMGQRLLSAVAQGRMPTYDDLLPNDYLVRLKRAMHARKSKTLPGIVTHDLIDDANDAVLKHLRHRRLFNAPEDPVKVIFHPEFLTVTSPLLGLDYDQFVRGCHLGVFPSYYEPWGYTPLECIALGLPAVTTDLSGFGNFVQRHIPSAHHQGILVLNRSTQSAEQSIEELTRYLFSFAKLTRRERIELRNRSEALTEKFDWSVMAAHYHTAHDEALRQLT